jgi:hypothetical protein
MSPGEDGTSARAGSTPSASGRQATATIAGHNERIERVLAIELAP